MQFTNYTHNILQQWNMSHVTRVDRKTCGFIPIYHRRNNIKNNFLSAADQNPNRTKAQELIASPSHEERKQDTIELSA